MKAFLVNYNYTPTWLLDPKYSFLDYTIADRSDDGIDHLKDFDPKKVIKTENVGNVDYDKLNYLIDNYDTLPEVFLWGKTNLFKYITKEEYEKVKDNKEFTPLLTQNHEIYADSLGMVNFYSDGIYHERNPLLYSLAYKYCKDYPTFAQGFQLPSPNYVPFAPGGNYILTRERVHRYSRDFYIKMASILPYCAEPLEAFFCERAYCIMWK